MHRGGRPRRTQAPKRAPHRPKPVSATPSPRLWAGTPLGNMDRDPHSQAAPMELTPREKDKLLIFTAALLAERRRARGLYTGA